MWAFRTGPAAQCDPYFCQHSGFLFKSNTKLKQNCVPVPGALGPSPRRTNLNKASVILVTLPSSHCVLYRTRSEAGRIAVANLFSHALIPVCALLLTRTGPQASIIGLSPQRGLCSRLVPRRSICVDVHCKRRIHTEPQLLTEKASAPHSTVYALCC